MRRRRRRSDAKGDGGSPTSSTQDPGGSAPGARRPADGSGRDVLGRLKAAVESIRRQIGARRRNSVGPRG
jgi:hypothetical protein